MTTVHSPKGRSKWLVIFNCQTFGLTNCLSLLAPDVEVEACHHVSYKKHADDIQAKFDTYDQILIAPSLEQSLGIDFRGHPGVWRVPTIGFAAYHPDLCYLTTVDGRGGPNKGPLSGLHSLIAFAAFRAGMSEAQVVGLYKERVYADLGYFDRWQSDREVFLEKFRAQGLDLSHSLIEWSRNGPFMYLRNHPRIVCLADLARAVLRRAGLPIAEIPALPHDNLANGPVFPVYPEIASRLGFRGSYMFKQDGKYRLFGLEQFIAESFVTYRQQPELTLRHSNSDAVLRDATSIIEEYA